MKTFLAIIIALFASNKTSIATDRAIKQAKPAIIFIHWDGAVIDNLNNRLFAIFSSMEKEGIRPSEIKKLRCSIMDDDEGYVWQWAEQRLSTDKLIQLRKNYKSLHESIASYNVILKYGIKDLLQAAKTVQIPLIAFSDRSATNVNKEGKRHSINSYFDSVIATEKIVTIREKYRGQNCWIVTDTTDHLQIAEKTACKVFYVGDVSKIKNKYHELTSGVIIITNNEKIHDMINEKPIDQFEKRK